MVLDDDYCQPATTLDRYREIADPLYKEFFTLLEATVGKTPGITGRFDLDMPYLYGEGDPKGEYCIGYGLSHHEERPEQLQPTFLWASYYQEGQPYQGKGSFVRPIDLRFDDMRNPDCGVRDTAMHVAMLLAAIQLHRTRLADGTATRKEY